ncbi:hypothetical protein [Streptomyces sp. NBC_01443]|uniref:hypothetical protein n=1 Tax=Streptomyces sp. NBC_01443 TaxID=2903868 RepID=UPI002254F064|nr:hypothetical protein [Streptomyces sp. NBC_01443]MCX4626632.1 hypothetical protein [Streptomyces sp. NBC_01443]
MLKNEPVGAEVTFNDDFDATPHRNKNHPDKGEHVDGWKAVKRADGTIKVDKKWA